MITSSRSAGTTKDDLQVIHPGTDPAASGRGAGAGVRRVVWPLLRIAMGFLFLWAFLDKGFSLGFATGRGDDGNVDVNGPRAWLQGGSPTEGYLANAPTGPFAGLFKDLAGITVVDWLFMLGMLGVGLALLLGIGLRIAAVAGIALMLMIRATFSLPENNPVVDEHLVYVLVLALVAVEPAAARWSAAGVWARSPLVRRWPVLR